MNITIDSSNWISIIPLKAIFVKLNWLVVKPKCKRHTGGERSIGRFGLPQFHASLGAYDGILQHLKHCPRKANIKIILIRNSGASIVSVCSTGDKNALPDGIEPNKYMGPPPEALPVVSRLWVLVA